MIAVDGHISMCLIVPSFHCVLYNRIYIFSERLPSFLFFSSWQKSMIALCVIFYFGEKNVKKVYLQ